MVIAGEPDQRGVVRHVAGEALDGLVHLEQQGSLAVLADHALNPEKRGKALATGDRLHLVQWRLIDAHGRVGHEHIRHLGYVVRPPATWPLGEAIGEEYGLVVPADLAPGTYLLAMRVAWRAWRRALVTDSWARR